MSDMVPSPLRSILVVDDDEALRTLFVALLSRQHFKVECVRDGAQALARLAEQSYDAVLLDLMMPVTSGYDVLARLAEARPGLLRRTIVTTGVSERDLKKIDRSTVFAVLRKPFDINCLVETINACIRQNGARERHAVTIDTAAEEESSLDGSIRKFESELPQLRQMLMTASAGERELMLRGELRRVIGKLGGAISAAASIENDATRAQRYETLGRNAWRVAAGHLPSSKHEH